MSGVLIIDKPEGLSSFDVVRRVRRLCKTRKVGHAGTLDPFATGVLPVAVGQATRLVEYLMAGDKEYVATMRLGVVTDTQDLLGQVTEEHSWAGVDQAKIEMALTRFVGEIEQVPPMYSAIKQGGQPLYKLARQGVEVERKARRVTVDAIELLGCEFPEVSLRVSCSKGTYIRTLCHDLGQRLGCGAHVIRLRRTRCGRFSEVDAVTLDALQLLVDDGRELPMLTPAEALAEWPGLVVSGDPLRRLRDGMAPHLSELAGADQLAEGTLVRLLDGDRLAALARCTPGGFGKRPGDFEILKVFPEVRPC